MAYIKGFTDVLGPADTTNNVNLNTFANTKLKKVDSYNFPSATLPYGWETAVVGTGTVTSYADGHYKLFSTANNDVATLRYAVGAGALGIANLANTNYTEFHMSFNITSDFGNADMEEANTLFGIGAAKDNTRANNEVVGIVCDTAKPQFVTKTGGVEEKTDVSGYFLKPGASTWYNAQIHIVYNRSEANWKCYVNGILAATHSTKVPTTVTNPDFYLKGDGASDVNCILSGIEFWVK